MLWTGIGMTLVAVIVVVARFAFVRCIRLIEHIELGHDSPGSEKKEYEGDLAEQAEKKELDKEKDKPLEPKAGVNRFLWDMRVFKPVLAPKATHAPVVAALCVEEMVEDLGDGPRAVAILDLLAHVAHQ